MPAFHRLATHEPPPSSRTSYDATTEAASHDVTNDHLPSMEIDQRSNDSTGDVPVLVDTPILVDLGSHRDHSTKHLGVLTLTILVFYNVSGGPFGAEAAVRAGGNRMALLGFLLGPLVWSIQEALLTAELGTTFPEAGAGVAWVEEAFGPKAGWFCGYLGWIAGATDNAIYPVLFLDYLQEMLGQSSDASAESDATAAEERPIKRFLLLSFASAVLGYINWRGLDVVGKLSVYIAVIAMSPFVIMTIVGSFKVDHERWLEWPPPSTEQDGSDSTIFQSIQWAPLLNNLFWNLNSFDAAGSFAGEIEPSKFHRGMLWGTLLVALCYFLPLLVAIGASPPTSERRPGDWEDGYLTIVNAEVVGPWLGTWTVMAAGISNIALFQAELSADAFQLMGMADRGHAPRIFGRKSQHGTPTYGIVLGLIVILLMDFVSNLDQLIEMLNFNYAVALLMEYAAFFQLRIKHPDLERPFRIPFGIVGCFFFFLPSLLATLLILSLAGKATYIMFASIVAVGIVMLSLWQKDEDPHQYDPNLPVSDPETDVMTNAETTGLASD
ncbi:unnamed protein product [Cylindrotheca closterium]|uniref:Amino acid transporter n=1 Tax=Cylindrotheca closterium TaxID=2856 RepID=A0AAD2CUY6_9STRA|nr:unnamed protein product [Cylindrotheca closterium]